MTNNSVGKTSQPPSPRQSGVQLVLMRARWDHMAAVSGFDLVAEAITRLVGSQQIVPIMPERSAAWGPFRFAHRVARRLGLVRAPSAQPAWVSPFVTHEREAAARNYVATMERNPRVIGLLLAGEEQCGTAIMAATSSIRSRTAVVLHQPASWLRLHWRDFKQLDGLRAIVAVSEEQARFLSTVSSSPVVSIKHGVSLEHFRPAPSHDNLGRRLLFVGKWLRDFRTLRLTMESVWENDPAVELDCVLPRDAREGADILMLARDPRVRWHADISAERLRELYTSATLLFLPVVDATANNAVVEALACGLPVISTAIGGMTEYVTKATGELCEPGDAAAHAAAILQWLQDGQRRQAASRAARAFAEQHFDWDNIATDLLAKLA
jgi:glycosyltransferase involved in cell wall biosynthesis